MSDVPYEQTGSYIPQTDGGFRDWLNNFATLIQADPVRYGLTSSDSGVISGSQFVLRGGLCALPERSHEDHRARHAEGCDQGLGQGVLPRVSADRESQPGRG